MKYLKSFNESIALDYLEELYDKGGMSSDAYEIVLEEDMERLKKFDNLGDPSRIKKKVLKHLDDVGAITSDVYEMEMDEL